MSNTTLLDEVIANASRVERVVPVCVSGGLVAEHQKVSAELEEAQVNPMRLGDNRLQKLQERLSEIEQEMRGYTYEFRFRALSAKGWSDLMAAHPDPEGQRVFNVETFPKAAISACAVEPEGMDDPEKVQQLLDILSPAQQGELFDGAWEANTDSPKGLTSSIESDTPPASVTNLSSVTSTGSPDPTSSA